MAAHAKQKCPPIPPRALKRHEAKPEPPVYPSTEEWMQANPDKVIRLEPGVWSNPLMFDLAGS